MIDESLIDQLRHMVAKERLHLERLESVNYTRAVERSRAMLSHYERRLREYIEHNKKIADEDNI